jgi:hypothetical protein
MMDETGEEKIPSRPNGGEALGGERRGDEGPQFYYSRERRLSKAPPSVRALYEDQGKGKFSLVRPLISSKPNAILFGTMAALILITLVMSFSGLAGGTDYAGSRITLSALRYEGAVLVVLKKTVSRPEAYTGPLAITVSPLSGTPAYPHRVVFSSRKTEEFRFSVPFDERELLVELSGDPGSGGEGDDKAPEDASRDALRLAIRVKTK